MTIWDLYKSSGVPNSTLCALMSETTLLPKLHTLHHICEGLGISIREFFDDDMFNETEQD